MNKIITNLQNAKWHTLWKNRMSSGKPIEGDYNFTIWRKGFEVVVEPWDENVPPSIFIKGEWVVLASGYRKEE